MLPIAHAYNFIDVGSGFATSTMSYASGLFGDFSVPVTLILGILVVGALITMLIKAFFHH